MFRSFVYVNTDKVYEYYSLIDHKTIEKYKSRQKNESKEVSVGFGNNALKLAKQDSAEILISDTFLYDYNNFEEKLIHNSGDYFFDLDHEDYNIFTIPKMSLVKLRSNIFIPKEFDFIELINKFKPLLFDQIELNTDNEHAAFAALLGNTKADIPIIIEHDVLKIFGKLDSRYLKESYTSLEDYETDEVTVLFKILSMNSNKNVVIFDPYKDFINFNRAMRRNIVTKPTEEFSSVEVEGPVLKVEIIAIYT